MRAQLRGDALDLSVVHLRKERQRDRSRAHVLAYREFALAVTEALAIEAHQMDRGQVRLALDAARGQLSHCPVSVDAARKLHDEHEPSAPLGRTILARQREPLDAL